MLGTEPGLDKAVKVAVEVGVEEARSVEVGVVAARAKDHDEGRSKGYLRTETEAQRREVSGHNGSG